MHDTLRRSHPKSISVAEDTHRFIVCMTFLQFEIFEKLLETINGAQVAIHKEFHEFLDVIQCWWCFGFALESKKMWKASKIFLRCSSDLLVGCTALIVSINVDAICLSGSL